VIPTPLRSHPQQAHPLSLWSHCRVGVVLLLGLLLTPALKSTRVPLASSSRTSTCCLTFQQTRVISREPMEQNVLTARVLLASAEIDPKHLGKTTVWARGVYCALSLRVYRSTFAACEWQTLHATGDV
jgi:hypothetical protein